MSALFSALSLATSYWNKEEPVERRTFLGALSGASLGVLSEGSFSAFARQQYTTQTGAALVGHSAFETSQVEV
jgi:hypothetical protein